MTVKDGEIGLPIYYKDKNSLEIGDKVTIHSGETLMECKIKGFIRDGQMNPSIITSKRLLVSDNDYEAFKATGDNTEYLIEFLLTDRELIGEFEQIYQASNLPQKDTALTY